METSLARWPPCFVLSVTSVFVKPYLVQSHGPIYQAGLSEDTQLYACKQVTLHAPSRWCQMEEVEVMGYRRENGGR